MLPSARQNFTPDRAPATPFADLIDSPPTPEPRLQRPSDDSAPRTDRTQNRTDSPKAARANDNDAPKSSNKSANKSGADDKAPAKTDTTADATKTQDGDKTADSAKTTEAKTIEAKTTEKAAESDKSKTATDDGQQTAEPKTDVAITAIAVAIDPIAAAAAAAAPAATAIPTAAVAAAAVPAAAVAAAATTDTKTGNKDDAIAPAIAATAAQPGTVEADKPGIAEAAKGQADILAVLQPKQGQTAKAASNDKTADSAKTPEKTSEKTPSAFDADGALQAAAGEPDKATAPAHAETTANHHRGVTPDASTAQSADTTNTAAPKAADNLAPQLLNTPTPHAPTAALALAPAAAPSAAQTSEPAVPVSGVGIEIVSKALSGKNQFDIRLDPPDLGRIHVRMDVDRDGNVITHMVADRSDTLDLLRRDTAGLERALQDAGLKTSDNSLQFSLRDQSGNQYSNNNASNNNNANTAHIVVEDDHLPTVETSLRDYARYGTRASGLDIKV